MVEKDFHLSFSTRTRLEISSGDLPDLRSNALPASLCNAAKRSRLSTENHQNGHGFGPKKLRSPLGKNKIK